MAEPTTATGRALASLVETLQGEIVEADAHFRAGLEITRRLEQEARGLPGLATALKGKNDAIQKAADDIQEEAAEIGRKLLGTASALTERVDQTRMIAIHDAKAAQS